MIKVGIIGATGYAGSELVRILLGHKDVKDTAHYLRISDEDIANEVMRWTSNTPNK